MCDFSSRRLHICSAAVATTRRSAISRLAVRAAKGAGALGRGNVEWSINRRVGSTWQDDLNVKDLVELIAARRTSLGAARKAITEFIVGTPAEKEQKAKQAFAGLFEALSEQRREVMDGLERVSRKEVDLATKIKSDVARLRELQDKPDADQTEIKSLASEIEWSTRIFEDRRKTIRYACEVPTTIEQRIFALARTIQQTLN